MSTVYLQQPNVSINYVGADTTFALEIEIQNMSYVSGIHLYYNVRVTDIRTGKILLEETSDKDSPGNREIFTVDIPLNLYYDVEACEVRVTAYVYYHDTLEDLSIAELCESTKSLRFNAVTSLAKGTPFVYLKAFCNMPGASFSPVYVLWEYSLDGVTWAEYDLVASENIAPTVPSIQCSVLDVSKLTESNVNNDSDQSWVSRTVWKLLPESPTDLLNTRPDVIRVPNSARLDNTLYRMRMFTVKEASPSDTGYISGVDYIVKTDLGMSIYTPVFSQQTEILTSELSNVSNSKSVQYGNVLYGFGNSAFKNYLVSTYPGETVRPMSRVVPLDTLADTYVTAIVPWKEHLVVFTEKTVHLVTPTSDGYVSRTVNTFIGVPAFDSQCCVPTLNGIIFKSTSSLYMLYPNMYAGTDSVLNLTEISNPVRSYLEEFGIESGSTPPFAIGTHEAYILMIPTETETVCLKYNYTSRVWTFHEYPIVCTSYEMLNVTDVRIFGYTVNSGTPQYGEYLFDTSMDFLKDKIPSNFPYVDCLANIYECPSSSSLQLEFLNAHTVPIKFELDSGQKSDTLNQPKQFVESKFNVATLHDKDAFPMCVTVYTDGNPIPSVRKIDTDSAFWKTTSSQVGTLSTDFVSNDTDNFNVFRQMFLRYSGRGKSIRHIIEGESLYPFKLYEIDYRYRNLNSKQ